MPIRLQVPPQVQPVPYPRRSRAGRNSSSRATPPDARPRTCRQPCPARKPPPTFPTGAEAVFLPGGGRTQYSAEVQRTQTEYPRPSRCPVARVPSSITNMPAAGPTAMNKWTTRPYRCLAPSRRAQWPVPSPGRLASKRNQVRRSSGSTANGRSGARWSTACAGTCSSDAPSMSWLSACVLCIAVRDT